MGNKTWNTNTKLPSQNHQQDLELQAFPCSSAVLEAGALRGIVDPSQP